MAAVSVNPLAGAGGVGPDPVAVTQALVRCPSVTPEDAGALDTLSDALTALGFACIRLPFAQAGTAPVDNLFARIGDGRPHICFAGHTDVVPAGDRLAWSRDPFGADIVDGVMIGRGTADMKGAIGAFVAAAGRFLAARRGRFDGSISLLITGDEEGPAINGTAKMLETLAERGDIPDACVVGEPTNPDTLGEMIKIGRRGSLVGDLTVHGTQGHTAYPHLADNAAHRLVRMLAALLAEPLDGGTGHFIPSNLEITTIDIGNPAGNVIPARAAARFNIRFNDLHSAASLESGCRDLFDAVGGPYELAVQSNSAAFLTPPGPLSDRMVHAVRSVTGRTPALSTTGGTSDARFIKDHCPVVEFGLINATIHKVDEQARVKDIQDLAAIYHQFLIDWFPA